VGRRGQSLRAIASVSLALLAFAGSLVQPEWSLAAPAPGQALVLLTPDADLDAAVKAIEVAGGHVTHVFPPAALIAEVPAGTDLPGGSAVYQQTLDQAALAALTGEALRAAQVWNALLAPQAPVDAGESLDTLADDLSGTALVAPPPEGTRIMSGDPTPGYAETSEYFIGRVAVGIVLPESDGSADASTEDWTEDERALVLSEITAALDWWAAREPNAHLTFVYDDGTAAPVPTSVEPIGRPATDQSLWIAEIMEKKGYNDPSYFDQVRSYNNDLRERANADWAFTVFVVDSSNDSDNYFSDGHFAYAYLGGPFFVMTYGNNGYGPENMDAVAAHEVGHIFLALDQYASAKQPCTRQSGYLGVENQNSAYGDCASDEPSIMRGHTLPYTNGQIDEYARGQVGWRDSDGDGILDPVDTTLSVAGMTYEVGVEHRNVLTFTGSVQDDPYPSPLRRSVVINTIERVQYRVASGEWMDAQPADGLFDAYTEDFVFTTPPLPTGELDVDLRVVDSAGNEVIETLETVSVVDPVDAILDTTMARVAHQTAGDQPTHLIYSGRGSSAVSIVADMVYRVDDGPWSHLLADDGAFDEPEEDFTLTIDLTDLSAGEHQVQAYAIDGKGNAETSPAVDLIFVQPRTQYIFLPLVMANS
jgi:hypothetical protein